MIDRSRLVSAGSISDIMGVYKQQQRRYNPVHTAREKLILSGRNSKTN